MEIATNCTGATFILTGDDRAECFEGVDYFNYFEHVLHRSEEDWPAVLHNIGKERQFCGRLGRLLSREGADPIVSETFYQAVVQSVLLFGVKTWVLTETMMQKLEGVHLGLLLQVVVMKNRKLGGDTWRKEGLDRVLQATGTKPL